MRNYDIQVLNQISNSLTQFKHSNNVYNFRCLYCGDSEKDKLKARGYIFTSKQNSLIIKCHNCSISVSFEHFLSDHFSDVYKEYKFTKYREKYIDHNKSEIKLVTPLIYKPDLFLEFKTISELHKNHTYKLYLKNRKISEKYMSEIFLITDFKKFTNTIIANKFIQPQYEDTRLTVPLILDKHLIGYQGRTIDPKNRLRYITIMLDNDKPKVWGFDKIDKSIPVYITEGIFDAMFIPNAIAMLGADVSLEFLKMHPEIDFVFIYDNEPRNPQIINRMKKVIDLGYSIVIWDKHIKQKDINDYIISGGIVENIINNFFSGIRAKLELNNWCK